MNIGIPRERKDLERRVGLTSHLFLGSTCHGQKPSPVGKALNPETKKMWF